MIAAPLQWPEDWPRHRGAKDNSGRFTRDAKPISLSQAIDGLAGELERLGAREITISMNINPSRTLSKQKRAEDPGVALYFSRGGRPHTMCQDRFDTVEGNARSLALAVKAMRDLERHGGGVIAEKAFEGFTGVPAVKEGGEPAAKKWWDILGVLPSAPLTAIRGAWRSQSAEAQKAGDMDRAARVNAAWAEAQKELRSAG